MSTCFAENGVNQFSLYTATDCGVNYQLLTSTEVTSLLDTGLSLPVTDPDVNILLGSVIGLLVLAYIFRLVLSQLFNR